MTTVTNSQPSWRSYMATGNPSDIVASPTVAAQFAGKVDAIGGQIGPTTEFAPLLGSTFVSAGTIVADAQMLRAYGAKFDGSHDDGPAFNAIIAASASLGFVPAPISVPTILFLLPAGTCYVATLIQSDNQNIVIRGAGVQNTVMLMAAGGPGIWRHGTDEKDSSGNFTGLAKGYFQYSDLMFQDGNISGSGSIGVEINMAPNNLPVCMTTVNYSFFKFTRPMVVRNVQRGWHNSNGTFFGPDNVIQPYGAMEIVSNNTGNPCFSYTHINVMTVNYEFGWDYQVAWQLEGQVFYSCRSYSGWGMVRAAVQPSALGSGISHYQSVIWYFTDCDWQGYGYALDMANVRNVVVRGGYYITNENAPTPPADPITGDARTTRAYFSFTGSNAVFLDKVAVDFTDSTGSDTSIVYADATTTNLVSDQMQILGTAKGRAAFEWASGGAANRCYEHETIYEAWNSDTPKILDGSNNQPAESFLIDQACGTVTRTGNYLLRFGFTNLTTDTNGRLTIPFPTRPNGNPFLIAGTPVADYSIIKSEASGVPNNWVYAWSSTEIVVQFAGDTGGTTYSGMCIVDGF
ncbi:glycoside hydrolase family 55 protein [Gluconobacter albidus]|uniref:glycoside hydrolase family 55 protein n=1 Tax=Gluconobacter albidus TaxID=318683 RepID=UPI0020A2297B|nr:glycoside hydrolase family 55 protein [Gluconobacter albidus]